MESHIGYLIKSINDKIKVHADADLKSHNLTLSQSRVLMFLVKNDGKATQKEIEDFLKVSHPTVVGLVSRMKENGFVTVMQDTDDRRNKVVTRTDTAIKTGSNMDKVVAGMEAKMLKSLSAEQIKQLTEMLETIYRNIK